MAVLKVPEWGMVTIIGLNFTCNNRLENSRPDFTGPALLLLHLFFCAVLTVILSVTCLSLQPSTQSMKLSLHQTLYEKTPIFACDPELVKVLPQSVCRASRCSIEATLRLCSLVYARTLRPARDDE